VLFNPKDDGVDFVELFNNSNSFFDFSKLRIANFFEFGGVLRPENSKVITEEALLFSPRTYLVLTTDTAKIKAQYDCEAPYSFIEVASMPTLSNDGGKICIIHQSQNQIIDAFTYYEDMHFSLLETSDGVSLERLDPNSETQNLNNWHSAASTVGFGTPTHKNSQELITQSIGKINVNPKLFTPNNDGDKDLISISWNFSKTNLVATIKIFDSEGRILKNILNNEMIGNSGATTWDGTSEEGLQLNTGVYIVWVEVFSENGNIERFKEVVVLSR
jgi:gliding motility-associated-like protein